VSAWGYVILGWVITFVMVVTYVAVVLQRGRRLSRQVPPGEQRWL
jgi:hypothetical protein